MIDIKLNTFGDWMYCGRSFGKSAIDDAAVFHEVCVRDTYRLGLLPKTFEPKVIVDIGANIGTFAMKAGRLFPKSWIYCFEPNREYFRCLPFNAPPNCSVHNVGVFGYVRKSEKVYISNSDDERWRLNGQSINAQQMVSLVPSIDLLKIDCEGSEVEILREMDELDALKNIPVIVGEWHFDLAKKEVRRILGRTHKLELIDEGDYNSFFAYL